MALLPHADGTTVSFVARAADCRVLVSATFKGDSVDYTVTLPSGERLEGQSPIVVIGPNGSGKTRQTRQIGTLVHTEFINALRNTRVAPELPAMGVESARAQYTSQKNNSRQQHWEIESDFDIMLSQLLAQQSIAAIEFTNRFRADPSTAGDPEETPLSRVEDLWGSIFPGRRLRWRDWKPLIENASSGNLIEYTANQMSDGEKAVLYLAGRVLSADPGVLVVDEPETHLHSLLAVDLWNILQSARPDIRFIYVTHDLTFALSRYDARFVLASPTGGLRSIEFAPTLPVDVTEALLGSASLSFYASRLVFCEGEISSLDYGLYGAWFSGPDTVVRPVNNCQRVLRCVEALSQSGVASGLTVVGIIDRDYNPDAFVSSLPPGVAALKVHEVESLLSLPQVVAAVSAHVGQSYDDARYRDVLANSVSAVQQHQIIIERWKRRMEPNLEGLVSGVSKRDKPVSELIAELPELFDHNKWTFSPERFLEEERERVEAAISTGTAGEVLTIVPGKQLLPLAARQVGMSVDAYTALILESIRGLSDSLRPLTVRLEAALSDYLPPRHAAVKGISPGV